MVSKRRYRLVIGGTDSVWDGTGVNLVVLGQYNLVLLGIKWNWVSTRLLCLYILKEVEIWLDDDEQRKTELLSQWTIWTAEMSNLILVRNTLHHKKVI